MYHFHQEAPKQPGRGEPINQNHNPLRLIERHFLSKKSQNTGRKRSRCVWCNQMGKRKDVIYECRKCGVAL